MMVGVSFVFSTAALGHRGGGCASAAGALGVAALPAEVHRSYRKY